VSEPRSPLRIGVACFSSFGGSGVVAAEIGMELGRRGHRVCFLSDKPPARLDLSSPSVSFHPVLPFDYPLLAERSYALALSATMVEVAGVEKLDLLHLHYALPHAASALLARSALGAAAPKVVTTLHGTDVSVVGSDPRYQALVRTVVAASDAITTPSKWLAQLAHKRLGLPADRSIEVIANFVDTMRFTPPELRKTSDRTRILMHVSNFRALKRVEDVVRVFAAVRTHVPTRLHFVGEGPERARAEALVASLGLGDHVFFFGEPMDLPTLLQASDVFLLPSQSESFGLAALEAMACGVPVVASDVGGIPEVVVDGVSGFLAPVGDVDGMADATQRLLTDDVLHDRFAKAARRLAVERFRLEPAVDRYEALYRRTLARIIHDN
jgi:N-acetyl-alpha-D-glucosaminyl L-malate synthase BshA